MSAIRVQDAVHPQKNEVDRCPALRLETRSPCLGSAAAQDVRSSARMICAIVGSQTTTLLRYSTALLAVQRLWSWAGCLLVSYRR